MKASFFSSSASPKGEAKSTEVTKPVKPQTVLGKQYSGVGTDKPIMCTLVAEPMLQPEASHFGLTFDESHNNESEFGYKYRGVYLAIDYKAGYLSITINLGGSFDNRLFAELQKQVIRLGIKVDAESDEQKRTQTYTYEGDIEKIHQLFPIIKRQLMLEDRYVMYGKEFQLTRLSELLENLFTKVENNSKGSVVATSPRAF